MDIKNMTTEEYREHLLKEVVQKVNAHEQGQFDQLGQPGQPEQDWGNPEYLSTLSRNEINVNWEKILEAHNNNK